MSTSNNKVNKLRRKIDRVDKVIIERIAERMKTSRVIGVLKKEQGLPIRDRKREQEMNALRNQLVRTLGLNKRLITRIFTMILNESRKAQK